MTRVSWATVSSLRRDERYRGATWALVDQALVSAANFSLLILLGRTVTPSQFGSFVLAYTVLVFASRWQAALVTQPHNTLAANRYGIAYRQFTAGSALLQVGFSCAAAVFTLFGAAIAHVLQLQIAPFLLWMSPAILVWQLQEFVRRVLFTEARALDVLKNDLICYGGQMIALVALWRSGFLTINAAMAVLVITSLLGALYGARQLRLRLDIAGGRRTIRTTVAEHWAFGRWLLYTYMLSWSSEALYPVLVGVMINTAATGGLRATETLFGPIQVLTGAMASLLVPRAASTYDNGGVDSLRHFLRSLFIATGPLVLLFCVIITLFSREALELLYGENFGHLSWLVGFLALNAVSNYIRFVVGVGLRAVGATAPMFQAGIWLSASVFLIGIPAIYQWGLQGFALAIVAGSLISTGAQWTYYQRTMKERSMRPSILGHPSGDVARSDQGGAK